MRWPWRSKYCRNERRISWAVIRLLYGVGESGFADGRASRAARVEALRQQRSAASAPVGCGPSKPWLAVPIETRASARRSAIVVSSPQGFARAPRRAARPRRRCRRPRRARVRGRRAGDAGRRQLLPHPSGPRLRMPVSVRAMAPATRASSSARSLSAARWPRRSVVGLGLARRAAAGAAPRTARAARASVTAP